MLLIIEAEATSSSVVHFTVRKSDSEHFNTTLMSEDNSSDVTLESLLRTIHRTDLLHKDDPDTLINFL